MPDPLASLLRFGLVATSLGFIGWAVYDAARWPRLEARACQATDVIDGDTLRVHCGLVSFDVTVTRVATVRLADVEAPERADCPEQARAAAERLAALVDGQPLQVTPRYRDRWGRVVANVATPAGDLGAALLSTGHAHPWSHDPKGRPLAARPKGC